MFLLAASFTAFCAACHSVLDLFAIHLHALVALVEAFIAAAERVVTFGRGVRVRGMPAPCGRPATEHAASALLHTAAAAVT